MKNKSLFLTCISGLSRHDSLGNRWRKKCRNCKNQLFPMLDRIYAYRISYTIFAVTREARVKEITDAVFTRDTFTWGKLTFLLYCVTFCYCEMTFTSRKRVSCKHDMRVENRREGRVVSLTIWSKLIAKQIPKFGKVLEMKETGTELTDTRDDWVLGALIAPGTLITWPAHHALFARTLTVHLITNFSRRPVRVTGARWEKK